MCGKRCSLILAAAIVTALPVGQARGTVGPTLQERIAVSDSRLDVIVILDSDRQVLPLPESGRPSAYVENRRALQSANTRLTPRFIASASAAAIDITIERSYWLAPMLALQVSAGDVARRAALPGVASVIEDAPLLGANPVRSVSVTAAVDATAAGQNAVGARALWNSGLTGKGTLVASIDTGVDGLHPALKDRYRGLRTGVAASWRDPFGGTFPDDPVGHGTHTIGTVLGRQTDDTVGIAPDAEWIAAGVVDRGLTFSQTIQDLLDAFQWLADPDGDPTTRSDIPDVVINSWGVPQGILPVCDETFWQVVDNLEALGAVVIFAAGNEGPGPGSLRIPADRGDEALKCFAVGAVDAQAAVPDAAPFSARGPASCNPDIIKPEILAPGVNVRSCKVGGGYQIMTGTSMAAPYVAGAVLLLRQYNPDATPLEIKQALVHSATDIGTPGPDNQTGYGLLNIPAAIDYLASPRPVEWVWDVPIIMDPAVAEAEMATSPLSLLLQNRGRGFERVTITLEPHESSDVIGSEAEFFFDYIRVADGMAELPFTLASAKVRVPGDRIWLDVHFRSESPVLDTTVTIGVRVGDSPEAATLAQTSNQMRAAATNVGRFDDFGSVALDVTGTGFAWNGRAVPFEGGLRLRHAGHDVAAMGGTMPFEPAPDGQLVPGDTRQLSATVLRDTRRVDPAGIELQQTVRAAAAGAGDYIIYDYAWDRILPGSVPVSFGVWFHWDLSGIETAVTPVPHGVLVQGDGLWLGAVWLSGSATVDVRATQGSVDALPTPGTTSDPAAAEEFLLALTAQPDGADQGRFAMAIVGAESYEDWLAAAARAREQYSGATGTADEVRPDEVALLPNYPNPFNPSTTIEYTLDAAQDVQLDVFNLLGRRVRTLVSGPQQAGRYTLNWDATDSHGKRLPSGVYLARLEAGENRQIVKMTLLR